MEADKAFHEEYKVKKKRQLLPYAAWMFVEEVMELVELKPLKTLYLAFLKLMVATEGVPDEHYPATWKLDVTTFSRKSKMSFDFAQTFDNLRCREQDQ
ncbi:hypothetical protein DY000_02032327 [Brassica cretica]|uniref:Uncharacterized protein n=1 Tax=Brassica cretica TaxID=69181 RepID=A0ABQ7DNF8_BRACR|nr:hypothetical protein DY000_02032327 [Brassica cretica]